MVISPPRRSRFYLFLTLSDHLLFHARSRSHLPKHFIFLIHQHRSETYSRWLCTSTSEMGERSRVSQFLYGVVSADSSVAFDKVRLSDPFPRILADMISSTDHGTSKLLSTMNETQANRQINKLSYGLDPNFVEPAQITMKVVQGCHNNVTTVELDVSSLQETTMKWADDRTSPPRLLLTSPPSTPITPFSLPESPSPTCTKRPKNPFQQLSTTCTSGSTPRLASMPL